MSSGLRGFEADNWDVEPGLGEFGWEARGERVGDEMRLVSARGFGVDGRPWVSELRAP